ncbi:Nucleoporin nup57 [Microsporum ferrugineum]
MALFGTQNQQPSTTSLFGQSTNQTQQSGSIFGAPQQQQQQQGNSLFGQSFPQKQQNGLFGCIGQQQKPSPFSGFGTTAQQQPQQQSGGFTLGSTQQQPQNQQNASPFIGFGATQQQQQQPQTQTGKPFSGFGSVSQPQQQQQPQLGQTLGFSQAAGSTIWTPGQGMTGVHRTVPMQIMIVKDKWDATSRSSPFRGYLYNNVGEESAPFFQPGPNDDENKWEEALRKRPGPGYVPVLVQGFWELGKRTQRQKDFLSMMQTRLHEINNALTELLSRHDLTISVKIAACRRKHKVLSQRCLALASKTQLLRNRGYAMDQAEEELAKKLFQLERAVFDPSLNGRSEEIWARMLAIRENSKRLQLEIERIGNDTSSQADDTLDDTALKTAKKILEDYATQIQHLNKELAAVQKDFGNLELSIPS